NRDDHRLAGFELSLYYGLGNLHSALTSTSSRRFLFAQLPHHLDIGFDSAPRYFQPHALAGIRVIRIREQGLELLLDVRDEFVMESVKPARMLQIRVHSGKWGRHWLAPKA